MADALFSPATLVHSSRPAHAARSTSFSSFRTPAALLALALPALASPAHANSWAAPQVTEVFSASRDHFVRITPGEALGETVGFGGPAKGPYATAEYYARQADHSYRLMHSSSLLDPVAPVRFFVSNDGRLATVDNWHNLGFGKVVAIYDQAGKLVKAYDLADLFPAAAVKAMPRSISSIHWRAEGANYIRNDQRTLFLHASNEGGFLFGLESGRFTYCENHEGKQRCRNSNADDAWHSGDKMIHR
jgi:hypothetical protein